MSLRIRRAQHTLRRVLIPEQPRLLHHHPHLGGRVGVAVDGEGRVEPLTEVAVAVVGAPEEDGFGGGWRRLGTGGRGLFGLGLGV